MYRLCAILCPGTSTTESVEMSEWTACTYWNYWCCFYLCAWVWFTSTIKSRTTYFFNIFRYYL